jgi:hypothetical protein
MVSVLKRKYGEELRATKYRNQVKEVKFKLLIHNRQGNFYFSNYSNEDFYRAKNILRNKN